MSNINVDTDDKEILAEIKTQIASFDSKAGILISIVSILLALSLSLIDILTLIKTNVAYYYAFVSLYLLYLLNAVGTIALSVLVIIPRNRPKNNNKIVPKANYYRDLAKMDYNDYASSKENVFKDEELFYEQLKANALICNKKHNYLRLTIYSLVPLALLLIAVVCVACVFVIIV